MFYAAVPFGAKDKGEQGRSLSKVCPRVDAQEFCVNKPISYLPKLLRAFDRQNRSPTIPKPKGAA